MNKLKQKIWAQLFVIYIRYLIGGAFVFSCIIKIKGLRFTTESGASNPINSAWHLFETLYQSGLYWKFLGICQLIAGGLLMTQRFATIGAICNLPIVLNIFIITLSYYFAFTPVITGFMLLANLLLVIWEWNKLKIFFNLEPVLEKDKRFENDISWEITGIALFIFTVSYRVFVNKYHLGFWLLGCILIGFTGFLFGMRRRKLYTN
jgi:hypothetical protein